MSLLTAFVQLPVASSPWLNRTESKFTASLDGVRPKFSAFSTAAADTPSMNILSREDGFPKKTPAQELMFSGPV